MNFPSQIFFNDINHGCRAAILKKDYLWLLPLYMVVATYFYLRRCAERCAMQLYQTSLKEDRIYVHLTEFCRFTFNLGLGAEVLFL